MDRPTNPQARLREQVARLPHQPGVYLFRDARARLLYVGKALDLRRRVTSYFHHAASLPARLGRMVSAIASIEVRPASSETEAFVLEAQLIKTEKPYFNVAFRDDKAYPLLKVTVQERFPRLLVTRRRLQDGALYFGPYPDVRRMHEAVRFLRRVFPLRTCRAFPKAPCLEYHIGQCLAPCAGRISESAYERIVRDLVAFLRGEREELLRDLARRMARAARDQRFEEAARLRDQTQALTSVIAAKEKSQATGPLEQLQAALKLPRAPRRIEAFDLSNIFGAFAVGSLVVFTDGRPHKAQYRRFRIETVRGVDDCAMMREVISRRYGGRLAAELPQPDLVLVDGGRGQLAAACAALAERSLTVPVIGLAKRLEHIVTPDTPEPIVLLPTSPVLHLLQRVRDEAHRFALQYHRRLRGKAVRRSALDAVRGVGPVRKRALLGRFGSLRALSRASAEEIAAAAQIPRRLADSVLEAVARGARSG